MVCREGGGWDLYWVDVYWMREIFDRLYMEDTMRINHFRNHFEVYRKAFKNPITVLKYKVKVKFFVLNSFKSPHVEKNLKQAKLNKKQI